MQHFLFYNSFHYFCSMFLYFFFILQRKENKRTKQYRTCCMLYPDFLDLNFALWDFGGYWVMFEEAVFYCLTVAFCLLWLNLLSIFAWSTLHLLLNSFHFVIQKWCRHTQTRHRLLPMSAAVLCLFETESKIRWQDAEI